MQLAENYSVFVAVFQLRKEPDNSANSVAWEKARLRTWDHDFLRKKKIASVRGKQCALSEAAALFLSWATSH